MLLSRRRDFGMQIEGAKDQIQSDHSINQSVT